MAEQFSPEWARGIIDGGVEKAQGVMNDPEQMDALLQDVQDKLQSIPGAVSNAFNNVPLMASMVKSYITREYTEVSPKVIISLVSTFLYLVTQKDLIPDNTPVIGFADDIAVATIAMIINEPEINAYKLWREQNGASGPGAKIGEPPIDVEPEVIEPGFAAPEASAEPEGEAPEIYAPEVSEVEVVEAEDEAPEESIEA